MVPGTHKYSVNTTDYIHVKYINVADREDFLEAQILQKICTIHNGTHTISSQASLKNSMSVINGSSKGSNS